MPGKRASLRDRLLRHIEINDNACWMWTGARSGSGYGQIRPSGRNESPKLAHRASYEEFVGKIPDGMFIDHLCYDEDGYSNKLCINPNHLEPVTDRINKRRGYVPKKAAGWLHYKQKGKNKETVE